MAIGHDQYGTRRSREFIVYHELRRAHCERYLGNPRKEVFYKTLNYDLNGEEPSGFAHRVGPLGLFGAIITQRPQSIELNEPSSLSAFPYAMSAAVAAWLLRVLSGTSIRICTYAIENLDPAVKVAARTGLPVGIVRRFLYPLLRVQARACERVAFGTSSAQALYKTTRLFRPHVTAHARVFPALPSACSTCSGKAKDASRAVFLGAFDNRKGVITALSAWMHVQSELPNARLVVMGQGALEAEVRARVGSLKGVELLVKPSRDEIHNQLAHASILIAPSQPSSTWREQVGLPVVEGLAHSCTVVTSSDTGLSPWLIAKGHIVVSSSASEETWASSIRAALTDPLPREEILLSLPGTDGRLQADAWLNE